MKTVAVENTFKKDMKRLQKRGWNMDKLRAYITLLQKGAALPPVARPHKLTGEYAGFWECHIEHDWLLIYAITSSYLLLVRTGSHADLFE